MKMGSFMGKKLKTFVTYTTATQNASNVKIISKI